MKKKKNKFNNFLKIGIFLFGISLLLWNCEKEDNFNVVSLTKIKRTYTQKSVKLKDFPFLKDKLPKNFRKKYKSRTVLLNEAIFEENILEVIDTLQNTNYTFKFTLPDNVEGVFYNLIIGRTPEGELKTPFVLEYKCDDTHLATFIANNYEMEFFKGTVSMHKYTDYFEQGYFSRGGSIECPPVIDSFGNPLPCTTDNLDGTVGSSGNGGEFGDYADDTDYGGYGEDTGSDYSGGGGGTTYDCTWAWGTNGPCDSGGTALHSPSQCGSGTGVQITMTLNCTK